MNETCVVCGTELTSGYCPKCIQPGRMTLEQRVRALELGHSARPLAAKCSTCGEMFTVGCCRECQGVFEKECYDRYQLKLAEANKYTQYSRGYVDGREIGVEEGYMRGREDRYIEAW